VSEFGFLVTGCNDPGLRFSVGQKWVNKHPIDGTFSGEVIAISDRGRRGTVVITDDRGNVLDTYSGSATTFQASGEWQLIEE
jgi:hypothetical protein